jgi:xylan 1,4-beta-xylosidase
MTACALLSKVGALTLALSLCANGAESGDVSTAPSAVNAPFPVTIRVDASQGRGKLRPIWRFFGADEPNYAYQKDGAKLLTELGKLGAQTVYFRAHNLLTTGDSTPALKWGSTNAYTEDEQENPKYDWTIVDKIFDTYLQRGIKPYVQIGFMPEALSSKPEPYQHHWSPGNEYGNTYTGWAYPPKDYGKWAELVFQWTRHCLEKYGRAEVEKWYWEVWNEPNIGYWQGKPEDYYKLYDYGVDGVRRALPGAKVGGPESTGPRGAGAEKFLRGFLDHCLRGKNCATGKEGAPLDFISFHAKGSPRVIDGHVQMGIMAQMQDIDRGFEIVASYPELKDKPIVLGESDPDGCAACSAEYYPQNAYRNGSLFASYTAASFAREQDIADKDKINFDGAITWSFEFENQPFFAGFRALATNGLDLPVLNVFRMFGKMSGQRVAAESSADQGLEIIRTKGVRDAPDVSALASLDGRKLSILVWHYHDNAIPGPDAQVELSLAGLPFENGTARLSHYRIDDEHSNCFEAWKRMGSPKQPSQEQYELLERDGQLAELNPPAPLQVESHQAKVSFTLPRQSVSLLVITPDQAR